MGVVSLPPWSGEDVVRAGTATAASSKIGWSVILVGGVTTGAASGFLAGVTSESAANSVTKTKGINVLNDSGS
jgi:hypothetical protein